MSARVRLLLATLVLASPAVGVAHAGWKHVVIDVALPPSLKTEPGERSLVALFRANDHERLDIGLEISRWLRRELVRQTALDVLDVPPPPIPEQRAERLAVNDSFWRQLGEDFGADLIIAGVAEYEVSDRSGFATEDVTSPITGQTVRRSRFVERRQFKLTIQVFFLKGDNGTLLHRDTWIEDRLVEGTGAEDLQVLFELLDLMADNLRAVFLPTNIKEPRSIWVE